MFTGGETSLVILNPAFGFVISYGMWTAAQWRILNAQTDRRILACTGSVAVHGYTARAGRKILRSFSSSFFLVTRFLPGEKRDAVNIIYAAVRYPDEIVDTFPISHAEKSQQLDEWQQSFERALRVHSVREAVAGGIPWILAGFAEMVRRYKIPPEHYLAFLDAMRRDADPKPFASLESLIEDYVYGSAVVVGYFLAHVYGTAAGADMQHAYRSARDLAIALQLTNFARDVVEDNARGRLYIPVDMLATEGLNPHNYLKPENTPALRRCIWKLTTRAERLYESAAQTINVFAPDTRPAIGACIGVYRQLNRRLMAPDANPFQRQTVPVAEKLRSLPPSKYWRVPLAYVGAI